MPAETRPVIRWNPAEQAWETSCRGYTVLTDPWLNKGTAFTEAERAALGLTGLLPSRVLTLDQQAQRDDQRCDGDLLEIDSQHIRDAKRHRECDRYCQRHDQRQPPLPKPNQRHQDDENNGFPKRPHEEVDVLLDLERLIGGVRQNQVGGKDLAKLRKL